MRRATAFAAILAATCPAGASGQAPASERTASATDRQAPGPVSLTLDEAIAKGLAASHRLAEATAQGDAAQAVANERRAAAMPTAAVQAGYTRTNHVDTFGILLPNNELKVIYPDIPDNYRTRLDLQWPIYTAGRLGALERAARAEAAASADDLNAARADLRLEITRAYWAFVTAIESVRVVEESLTRVRAHLQDVRNQFNAGLVPPNDVSSVEAQESRERMLTVQARSVRNVAEAELGRLIGVAPGTPVHAVSPLELPPAAEPSASSVAPPQSTPAAIEEARASRAERAGLTKRVAAAEDRRQAAASQYKPTVGVGGGVDYARPNPRLFPREKSWRESWDASVNLTWNLFDGGRTAAEIAEAAALKRAADERLADFDSTLAVEVHQRLSELEASRAAVSAAEDGVRSAAEARRVVGDRFGAGVTTSTDVLDAQVALLQAQLDRTQAIANARLAEARLSRALGR
jgi:outer membrane protein